MPKRASLRVVSPQPEAAPLKSLRSASRLLRMRSRSSEATLPSDEEPLSSTPTPTPPAVTTVTTELGTEVAAAETLHELAMHEFDRQRYDAALDCWAQALGHDETWQPVVLWNLVKLHLEMGFDKEEHRRAAEMHFQNLQPHLSSLTLDRPTRHVLEFLVEHQEWDASIEVAKQLQVDSQVLARIYFERSLVSSSPVDSLELCLAEQPEGKLLHDAQIALIEAYTTLGNYERALQLSKECLETCKFKSDKANIFYRQAEILAALGRTDEAMTTIEKALALLPKSPSLLQAKADLLFLCGNVDESIAMYEHVLTLTKSPLEQTKILYTVGRIVHKTGQLSKALSYYERELKITKKAFGTHHLECSRIYHEMAQVNEELCRFDKAIACCKHALHVERLHWKAARGGKRKEELRQLVTESQNKMGRLYYKKGDFGMAVQSSFGTEGSTTSL